MEAMNEMDRVLGGYAALQGVTEMRLQVAQVARVQIEIRAALCAGNTKRASGLMDVVSALHRALLGMPSLPNDARVIALWSAMNHEQEESR